jgi:hypothetical protein
LDSEPCLLDLRPQVILGSIQMFDPEKDAAL